MTIDQMLVYIPQLTARKNKLNRMRSRLPKERVQGGMSRMSGIVEYEYSNYDIKQAEADYAAVSDELVKAQNALDAINALVAFSVEIEYLADRIQELGILSRNSRSSLKVGKINERF